MVKINHRLLVLFLALSLSACISGDGAKSLGGGANSNKSALLERSDLNDKIMGDWTDLTITENNCFLIKETGTLKIGPRISEGLYYGQNVGKIVEKLKPGCPKGTMLKKDTFDVIYHIKVMGKLVTFQAINDKLKKISIFDWAGNTLSGSGSYPTRRNGIATRKITFTR